MIYASRVSVAPGDGRLAARPNGVLFVPDGSGDDDLIKNFLDVPLSQVGGLLSEHVLTRNLDAPSFVLITWPDRTDGASLHVVVRGDCTVSSSMPSLPRLSGTGSSTWVEHRVPSNPETAELTSGDDALTGTDLRHGIVPAAGFRLVLEPQSDGGRSRPVASTEAPVAARTPRPAPEPRSAGQPVGRAARGDALTALRQITGMAAPEETDPEQLAAPPDDPTIVEADENAPPQMSDAEGTPVSGAPVAQDIPARICPAGHANPPRLTHCRVCDAMLDPAEPVEWIEQPQFAIARLADGTAIDLIGTTVIGRRPTAGDGPGRRAVAISAPSSVSRTHVELTVDGWTLTVTDTGSQGGTAVIPRDGTGPVDLVAHRPHPIEPGDVLHLGGPTTLTIEESR